MLFRKKKEAKPVPPEEVQKLLSQGMSDKDIIKHLKSKGYPYEEIEKAMMGAVKRGVEEPAATQYPQYTPFPQQQTQQRMEKRELPELPELGEYSPPEQDIFAGLEATEPEIAPDIIVEEIVEGVVEEKWQKFEDKIKKMENDFTNLSLQLKKMEQLPTKEQPTKDYDAKIADISEQLEDLQARVGGLEKAFKQFLPSLTKNIESLSNLIHEMKEKHGIVQEA